MGLQNVITRVQLLWEDVGGTWCDKDYIQGFIALHNEDVESELAALDLSYDRNVVVLPSVPRGTGDLSAFQAEGQLLENMMTPVSLEWRRVGDDDSKWARIQKVDKVIDAVTSGGELSREGIASYEWRGGVIHVTPSSVDVDIRVRDEELPAVLDTDSATYIKGLTNVLVYGVCELIAATRSGAGKFVPYWAGKKDKALSDVEDRLVKSDQITPRRMAGRRSVFSGSRWRIPFRSN